MSDGQRFERGYVSFEFVMSQQMLETYLGGIPVYVSLFQKDKYQKNVLIGEAVFMLDEVVKGTSSLVVKVLNMYRRYFDL